MTSATDEAPGSKAAAADANVEATSSSGRDSSGEGQSKQPAQAASPTVSASAKKLRSKKNRRCDVTEASKTYDRRRSDRLEIGRQDR